MVSKASPMSCTAHATSDLLGLADVGQWRFVKSFAICGQGRPSGSITFNALDLAAVQIFRGAAGHDADVGLRLLGKLRRCAIQS